MTEATYWITVDGQGTVFTTDDDVKAAEEFTKWSRAADEEVLLWVRYGDEKPTIWLANR